jgi:hypothetical protein
MLLEYSVETLTWLNAVTAGRMPDKPGAIAGRSSKMRVRSDEDEMGGNQYSNDP